MSWRKCEVGCVEVFLFWWKLRCFHCCQYQAVLITAVSLWPSPPAAHHLAPPNRSYLRFHWLSDFSPWQFLSWCYSFLFEFISRFTFSGAWAISRGQWFIYAAVLPSFILFMSLNKYVNTVTVMCCLASWCSFIVQNLRHDPDSLLTSSKVPGPAHWVQMESGISLYGLYSFKENIPAHRESLSHRSSTHGLLSPDFPPRPRGRTKDSCLLGI